VSQTPGNPAAQTACVNAVRALIADSATARASTITCGPTPGSVSPDLRVRVVVSNYAFEQVTPFVPIPAQLPTITAEFRHEFQ
jgi:hypothetical protein